MRRGDSAQVESSQLGGITPLYASPELFRGSVSPASDQYSLALVYHRGPTCSPEGCLSMASMLASFSSNTWTAKPDLHLLPAADRPAVARALAKEPQDRFRSCMEFVQAIHSGAKVRAESGRPARQEIESDPGMADARSVGERTPDTDYTEESEAGKETVSMSAIDTKPATGTPDRERVTTGETLAGHSLLRCLHTTPLTEVWKARSPAGSPRLVKCIFGIIPPGARSCEEAIVRLQELQHPRLLPRSKILQNTPRPDW